MTRRVLVGFTAAMIALASLVSCSAPPDYTARFIEYRTFGEGEGVAVVAPVQQADDRQTALTHIPNLKPGTLVLIRYTGRSWDSPQTTPEREIVARAGDE